MDDGIGFFGYLVLGMFIFVIVGVGLFGMEDFGYVFDVDGD